MFAAAICRPKSNSASKRFRRTDHVRLLALAFWFAACLASLLSTGQARGQTPRHQPRLAALRQLNALQQQQVAVQTAVQQTSDLVQKAYQSVRQQNAAPNLLDFQSQRNALQIALQQTAALYQSVSHSNSALAQIALRQQNALQTALQQSIAVQGTLSAGNPLAASQLQMLFQEQTSLMGLLSAPPPQPPRRAWGR